MLNKTNPPNDESPSDVMEGRCPACGAVIQCLRIEAEMREVFGRPLPCAPCPRVVKQTELGSRTCGARVHVARKRN